MKQCPNCSAFAEDEAVFCIQCGSRFQPQQNPQPSFSQPQAPQGVQDSYSQPQTPNNFNAQPQNAGNFSVPTQNSGSYSAPVQNINQGGYSQPQTPNNFNAQPQNVGGFNNQQQTQYQAPIAPQMPKKKGIKAWSIILIVVGGIIGLLVILGIIGAIANSGDDYYDADYDYYDSDYNYDYDSDFDSNSSIVTYTKGSVVDGWYVNEWANLKFEITDNWENGDSYDYSSYENITTDAGLVVNGVDGTSQLAIVFEELTGLNASMDEEEYLDIAVDGLATGYDDAGIPYSFVEDYYYTTIAGEVYLTTELTLGDNALTQKICVKRQGDYMIFIAMSASDGFSANAALYSIYTVN